MTWQWIALAGPAALALCMLLALAVTRSRTRREIAAARAEAADLRERLDRLEQHRHRPEPSVPAAQEYRITHVGEPDPGSAPPDRAPVRLERAVFADLVLRESVIRLGSLAHGVRRALSPESRNRIRFEMRREVKRARKQRRADQRQAWREWQARQRSELTDEDLRETA